MVLHELHKRAEWYAVPDSQRTGIQRLAARTQGIITPANVVSLLGLAITLWGLLAFYQHSYTLGLVLVGIGRLADILDGYIARQTHTTSPFGEGLDAGFDKAVVLAAVVLLTAAHVLPLFVTALVIVIQLIIAGLALAVRHDGTGIHPSRSGKYAMFVLWVAIGLFMVARVVPEAGHDLTWTTAVILALVAVAGQAEALREYWRAAHSRFFGKD